MVPPDGDRAKRLPTLSWESVVDDGPATATPPAAAERPESAAPTAVPPPPPSAPLALPSVPTTSTGTEPLTFEPMTLTPAPGPTAEASTADVTADGTAPAFDPVTFEPMTLGTPTVGSPPIDESAQVRTTPPAPVVPAIGDVEIGPADVAPASAPSNDALPEIREATPVDATTSSEMEVLARDEGSPSGPRLPSFTQPDQRAATPAAAAVPIESPATTSTPARARHGTRRRSRRGLKLLMTLVVLAGLVAAAVVFGRPYLFPDDWDDVAAPYADIVETGLELEFVEPVAVIAEPTADFDARVARQLLGESAEEPQWRALGLTTNAVTVESIAQQVTGSQSAMYSTEDGQVYHDDGATGSALDAQLTAAMAAASLDQNFAWSVDQPVRTLDDAASTSAEVLRQARAVQRESEHGETIAPVTTAQSAQLPAVLAYRALAPENFAEFGNPVADGADNPLHRLGESAPGPLAPDHPIESAAPTMIGGDVVVTPPQPMDRSFWFLVFAGFLDSRTSYSASEAIVENSLTVAERGATSCVYATFSGGGVDETSVLRTTLQAWSDAVPVEFASSFSVLDDGTLQLVTCDPGAGFQAPTRPSAATELIAWRMLELATIEQVGSGDADDPDFAFVWPIVQLTDVAVEVGRLPADTPPAVRAAAIRDGVAPVFAPTG